jgi:hypothetical protein
MDGNDSMTPTGDETPVPPPPVNEPAPKDLVPDNRLYVPNHEDWDVCIKRDSDRQSCYAKLPGEEWFHLILAGEIYVMRQHERYCLRCALRLGFLTLDRLFWQHRVPKKPNRVL